MKIKKFEDYKLFEDGEGGGTGVAYSSNGNSGGMGAIVAPIASSIPGDVAGSTRGSGDLPSYDTGKKFEIPGRKNKKRKYSEKLPSKTLLSKENRHLGKTNDISSMYVTKYTDWTDKQGLSESLESDERYL